MSNKKDNLGFRNQDKNIRNKFSNRRGKSKDLRVSSNNVLSLKENLKEEKEDIKSRLYVFDKTFKKIPACGKKLETGLFSNGGSDCLGCKADFQKFFMPGKELDYCRALHAEENAILSNPYTARRVPMNGKTMILFTSTFPCMLCSKKIANSGIKKVIFVEPYPITEAHQILAENGVAIEAFEGIKSLKFNWIFRKRAEYLEQIAITMKQELLKLTGGEKYEKMS